MDVLRRLERGTCVVCGSGTLEPMLREAARALPEGRLELRGYLDPQALSREIERAQFCVLPSECFENAPLAVLDAMHAARAVLASDIGGIPELVEHGVTGVLVAPGNVSAWVDALHAALDAPGRMHDLGAAARRRVEERFSLRAHVEALETHYREVLA